MNAISERDWTRTGPNFARRLSRTLTERLISADSAKGNRITEALISGTIDAYREACPGANAIFASAHQNRIHLREQHPDVTYEDQKPDRDLTLCGGGFDTVGEFETSGGPKQVVADFGKIRDDPSDKLKLLATRALSPKQQGRYHDMLRRASEEDGGCYVGIEVQLAKDRRSSRARIDVVCFSGGDKLDCS